MPSLRQGWDIQVRVIGALMIRELTTRFGRENIGFLWIMAEPMLFALSVGVLWRFMKGPYEFGFDIVAFTVSGYIPMVLFRSVISRSIMSFTVNGNFMYHRQIKVLDILLVRFLIELIGHMMAYLGIALFLGALGIFPAPYDVGFILLGGAYYAFFTLSVALVLAPLSEISETLEKITPLFTYIMIPLSGAFYFVSALSPKVAEIVLYSPPVHGMEMMRLGLFGPSINPQFDYLYPLTFCLPATMLGLTLCRIVRRRLVVE
jgi:capsular polysaccharide transport system permease protein